MYEALVAATSAGIFAILEKWLIKKYGESK